MQATPAITRRRRERWFYIAMSIAAVITVFAGFAPTYYLRPYFNTAPLIPLLHLHGIVFTSWLVLFLIQTTLVAAHRTDIHRRLGILGGVVAALMIVIGPTTAVIRASQGATPVPGVSPLSFLVVPLGDMFVFAILVGAGFYFRRRPDVHKRLMLLATISILAAAIARLPFAIMRAGPPAFFGFTDLFVLACIGYDLITLKRVHRATVLGALLIIASQPLRLMLGGTHVWLGFAGWLTHLVR
ncbi:MAG TPA: hypothetical protein VHR36_15000 [Pyrinomonadaceae bacterium]|jgi:hypothetical protein|nr:hypothetical protein [Pyrinomonadaceae bacterium]